jgi:C4-dicarboxylate transporter, DctQ subunit
MKVIKWLDDHFEEVFLAIFLVLICCVSLLQVVVRKLPFVNALTWAEEFCRFMWVWSVFLSLPYTIRKGSMLRVSVLLDAMPHVMRKSVNIFVDVVVTASMALCSYHSIGVVQKIFESGEVSPAMLWSMGMVYSVMVAGFVLGTVRGVQQIVLHIKHFSEKEMSAIEQTMAEAAEEANAGRRAEGLEGGQG